MCAHAQVGKAWLYLSKAYQNYGAGKDAEQAKEKSEAALFRCAPHTRHTGSSASCLGHPALPDMLLKTPAGWKS